MRAFVVNDHVHPSQIRLTVDAPEPCLLSDDDILVDVHSAALNFFDILQAQGKYQHQPPLPFVLGHEFAGKIAANSPVPKGCPFKPGDRVCGVSQGAFADRCVANWKYLVRLPRSMTFDQGSCVPVTWPTSYEALTGSAGLKAGEWVLVIAALGGVGSAAVQIAKALGAKVIAGVGSLAKVELVKRYIGADHVVNYASRGWQKEVMQITNGKGVDVVFDPVGRIRECLKCIAWKGRALVIGFAGGEIEALPLNIVLLKSVSVIGVHWGEGAKREPMRMRVVWRELLDLFESGRVKPIVYDTMFSLKNVQQGLMDLENRKTWGKVVVRVKDDPDQLLRARM